MTDDIWHASATELSARIAAGELSPVEVVESCLARIEDRDDDVNAFVTVCAESARERAREAEAAIEAGASVGPLHGLPVAIKDLIHVGGVRTTFGSNLYADYVAEEDDLVVRRLQAAGAIVIGKTNTSEFGRKPMTTNLLVGATGNPWDLERTVGGSSGGSAAAVADGMVPLAIGSDAAGSIRIPAAACGVVGLMPDFGRIPLGPRDDQFVNLLPYTGYGPLTRTVEDAALMMDVMAGPHHRDPYSLPARDAPYAGGGRIDPRSLDVAWTTELLDIPLEEQVRARVEEAVDAFAGMGAEVTEIGDPCTDTWERYHEALEILLQLRYRGLHDSVNEARGIEVLDHASEVSAEVVSRMRRALDVDALDYHRARRLRTAIRADLERVLSSYDLLLTPTLAMTPFEKDTQPTDIEGVEIDPLHGWVYTWPLNLTGHPAASLPAGFTDGGLPVGIQVIGRRFEDDVILAAAAAYQDEVGFPASFGILDGD